MPSEDDIACSYHALDEEGLKKDSEYVLNYHQKVTISWRRISSAILVIAAFISTAAAGFLAGRNSSAVGELAHENTSYEKNTQLKPVINLQYKLVTFVSNKTYLERPSPENDNLWKTLYPDGNHGFFSYPKEDPVTSTFAGFHQLHCVDSLRKRWWQDQDIKNALINGEDVSNIPEPISHIHVQHCVEFLRQSIMCHADVTLQVADSSNDVPAFGYPYQCKDWWQAVDWVNSLNKGNGD